MRYVHSQVNQMKNLMSIILFNHPQRNQTAQEIGTSAAAVQGIIL